MFRLIKKLVAPFSKGKVLHKIPLMTLNYQQYLSFSLMRQNQNGQHSKNINIFTYSFSSLRQLSYQEDFQIFEGDFVPAYHSNSIEAMKAYTDCSDLSLLTNEEVGAIGMVLSTSAKALNRHGYPDKACIYIREAENLLEKLDVKDSVDVSLFYFELGSVYLDLQKFIKAEECLSEADRIFRLFSTDEVVQAPMIENWKLLGMLFFRKNEHEKALEYFDLILTNTDYAAPEGLPFQLVETYQHIGEIYQARKDVEKYRECLEKSLDANILYFGETSAEVIGLYFELALSLLNNCQFSEALAYGKKLLPISQEIFSKTSPDMAYCYSLLGKIYLALKDYSKALENFEKSLNIFEKSSQDHVQELNQVYVSLSRLYEEQGNQDELINYSKKAYDLSIKMNAGNDKGAIDEHVKRAFELADQEAWKEARSEIQNALNISESREPQNYSEIADLYGLMGQLYYGEQDWNTAIEFFKQSEDYLSKVGISRVGVTNLYRYMLTAYHCLDNYDETLKYCNKIIQAYKTYGETLHITSAYLEMGSVYDCKGMLKEALEAYQEAKTCGEQYLGDEHQKTQKATQEIFRIQNKLKETNGTSQKILGILKSIKFPTGKQ